MVHRYDLAIERHNLPRVDALLTAVDGPLPRDERVASARYILERARREDPVPEADTVMDRFRDDLHRRARQRIRRVINATGILLHTNLGRAPVDAAALGAYTALELDLLDGRRGVRAPSVTDAIERACGAERALVVNNGAAALLLVLTTLAAERDVIVSRGELIEIGGSFRIPDVVATCGARIVEVGTTNRTRAADYAGAMSEATAVVLKVHTSNYRVVGFTEHADVAELATLGRPVVVDLGSGLLDEQAPWLPTPVPSWLRGEPGARQALQDGAAVVVFSGDKLLGGPQAGIIAGDRDIVERCTRHPLARALRPGKAVLSLLQATLDAYLDRQVDRIPFWRMALLPTEQLRARAERLAAAVAGADAVDMEALAGGGALPGTTIPSAGITLADPRGALATRLRHRDLPVIGRVDDRHLWLDLRTVDDTDDAEVARALREELPR